MKRFSSLLSRSSQSNDQETLQKVERTIIPSLILGPKGSGKTTFLYKSYFKYSVDQPETPFDVIPTVSYNVETIPFGSQYSFEMWDFPEISGSLEHIKKTQLVIYFMDSVELCKEAVSNKCKENMIWMLQTLGEQLKEAMILTVANKQHEPGAMDIQDIGLLWTRDKTLMDALKGHDWRLFSCNTNTGVGIYEIFTYVSTRMSRRRTSTCLTASPSAIVYRRDSVKPWENIPNPYHLNDLEFKEWFFQGNRFVSFDYWCLIRVIYLTLVQTKNAKRRSSLVLLHDHLKNYCRQAVRISDDQMDSIEYSETQTLFWIHMVSFGLLQLPLIEDSFSSFLSRTRLRMDCWKDHYTQRLFFSDRAARDFLPPDKKPLPNAFKPSSLALKGSGLRIDYQVL
ncbi:hypothetical protein BY458DRAFT_142988 [Sporodiniella umbellata]|nr:hypothetical protein BY458DRAFT_142988 [Sporodiniella umbellata]